MPVHDETIARSDEIEGLLREADEQWRLLEVRLEEAEENFLEDKLDSLKKWFHFDEGELQNWNVGSLRHSIRDRIRRLTLQPLTEKLVQRIGIVYPTEEEADAEVKPEASSNLVEDLLKYFDTRVKPVINEARSADEKLAKKIRKTEKDETKAGVVALTGDTKKVSALKRQRPVIWEEAQKVLEKFGAPMGKVRAFFSDEMSQEMHARMVNSVPAIVSRAICDWYFQRCQLDLDQLEKWWKNTKATLQQKDKIWDRLKEQEARLLRNVEAGLEDLCNRRHRYSMYATFGGSEIEVLRELTSQKLEESVTLLATVVSEMHKRLRMIRDGALWRVVDSVRDIQLKIKAEAADVEVWPTIGLEEGVLALAEAIGCPCGEEQLPSLPPSPSSASAAHGEDLCDAALAVMARLEKLVGVCLDTKDYFEQIAASECQGVSAVLDATVSLVGEANEELLVLMDEPSPEMLRDWLQQWARVSEADAGDRIDKAMAVLPLKRDHEVTIEPRRVRRRWLALLRGVQVLLNHDAVRRWAVTPLTQVEPESPLASCKTSLAVVQEVDVEELSLSTPPSPRGVMLAPPGGGLPYRPPERRSLLDGEDHVDEGAAGVPMGNETRWHVEPPFAACEDALEKGLVPVAPSSRPSTPGKFVDGAYVSYAARPNSASTRLPPLAAPSSLAKPVKQAW